MNKEEGIDGNGSFHERIFVRGGKKAFNSAASALKSMKHIEDMIHPSAAPSFRGMFKTQRQHSSRGVGLFMNPAKIFEDRSKHKRPEVTRDDAALSDTEDGTQTNHDSVHFSDSEVSIPSKKKKMVEKMNHGLEMRKMEQYRLIDQNRSTNNFQKIEHMMQTRDESVNYAYKSELYNRNCTKVSPRRKKGTVGNTLNNNNRSPQVEITLLPTRHDQIRQAQVQAEAAAAAAAIAPDLDDPTFPPAPINFDYQNSPPTRTKSKKSRRPKPHHSSDRRGDDPSRLSPRPRSKPTTSSSSSKHHRSARNEESARSSSRRGGGGHSERRDRREHKKDRKKHRKDSSKDRKERRGRSRPGDEEEQKMRWRRRTPSAKRREREAAANDGDFEVVNNNSNSSFHRSMTLKTSSSTHSRRIPPQATSSSHSRRTPQPTSSSHSRRIPQATSSSSSRRTPQQPPPPPPPPTISSPSAPSSRSHRKGSDDSLLRKKSGDNFTLSSPSKRRGGMTTARPSVAAATPLKRDSERRRRPRSKHRREEKTLERIEKALTEDDPDVFHHSSATLRTFSEPDFDPFSEHSNTARTFGGESDGFMSPITSKESVQPAVNLDSLSFAHFSSEFKKTEEGIVS